MANPTFSYNYNPLKYEDAQKQVSQQIDPLYQRAIQNVNQQKYQSDVQAGQVAAARGLGHSGLAADQLNKIAIAAQGQIGDISSQRASQMAQMAADLMDRDKQFGLQSRSQAYNEWQGAQDLAWRQKEWDTMSPAEKARMALEYQYSKKSRGGGGGGRRKSTSSSVPSKTSTSAASFNQAGSSQQSNLDRYYSNPIIQNVEAKKSYNSLYGSAFGAPTPPAQSPYLTEWEKMRMFGK